ncbi:MAG TPA: ABC transporter permease, partial [Thiocapsa sp.]|nr:ABC transporter permease [Thiocapsa sp.]
MWRRILTILIARNREFYRDRAGLSWNILMPIMMVLAFAFIFSDASRDVFKVGVIADGAELPVAGLPFLQTSHIQFIPVTDPAAAIAKVERHQLDLLVDPSETPRYWVNSDSANGYLVERLLRGSEGANDQGETAGATPQRVTVSGAAL